MRFVFALFSLAAVLVVAVSVLAGGAASAQSAVTVSMGATTGPDGGGDQTGTATLTATGSQTEVVVAIDSSPDGATVEQPAHVHAGTCANLGGVEYPLTNVVDGASTTTIDVDLASLQTGAFAINVHKSGTEIGVYTSCGDIPAAADPGTVPTTGGPPASDDGLISLPLLLAAVGAAVIVGGGATVLVAGRAR